ncbi:MAG TPA: MFS transporter [Spongiibacteraceae bacterium]|nr:MFS transporter [Spongiibacteraceae bacterium]HCS25828.1 MFS transporter [Spongiibacteraceae bacterium]
MKDYSRGRRFLGLQLLPTVGAGNLATFYLACVGGIMLATFMPQMQPYLLSEFLNIPQAQQGVVSGNIAFWGEIAIILAVGVWGSLSDKIGRKPVMAVGFGLMAISIVLYPQATSYHELLVYRVLFGLGVAAFSCMTFTILADYIADESRGKATGILGVCNGIGAMITVFFLLRLPSMFQAQGLDSQAAGQRAYLIVAAIAVVIAIVMWLGLKPRTKTDSQHQEPSIRELTVMGFRAAKDPGIALAYGAAFVSRGNLAIVGTFFTLWLANYGTSVMGLERGEALAKAGIIVGIAQGVTLLGAPMFGILCDKINRVHALAVALLVSFAGYGGTYFIDDPFSSGMIVCAILIGLGEVGGIITSGVLLSQQAPPAIRGAVNGCFNLCGAIGILVAAKFGGYLFDHWRESGPFVFFGLVALAIFFWALAAKPKVHAPDPAADAVTGAA